MTFAQPDDTTWLDDEPLVAEILPETKELWKQQTEALRVRQEEELLQVTHEQTKDVVATNDTEQIDKAARRAMQKLTSQQRVFLRHLVQSGRKIKATVEYMRDRGSDISYSRATTWLRKPYFRVAYELLCESIVRHSSLGTKAKTVMAMSEIFDEGMKEVPIVTREGLLLKDGEGKFVTKKQSLAIAMKAVSEGLKHHRGGDVDERDRKGGYTGPEGPRLVIQVINKIGQEEVDVTPEARQVIVQQVEPE